MKIFLDANVLFSASNDASAFSEFITLLKSKVTLVTSGYALQEAERNIKVKRPKWEKGFYALVNEIQQVETAPLIEKVPLVEKDRPILGAAIASGCDYLLTGDKKDFGHLYGKSIEGVVVINYTELAKIILGV